MNAPVAVALRRHCLSAAQELSFQVDGARNMKVLCVAQSDGQDDTVMGKASVQV